MHIGERQKREEEREKDWDNVILFKDSMRIICCTISRQWIYLNLKSQKAFEKCLIPTLGEKNPPVKTLFNKNKNFWRKFKYTGGKTLPQ